MQIVTIEQLIENLNDADPYEQAGILKQVEIPKAEFESYTSWQTDDYTRNCVHRNDDYELILLCWEIGAKTPIHDHAGEDCWVYQVSGTVKELRYIQNNLGKMEESNSAELTEQKLTYMHDRMGFHSIENISDERAMTLHIYASPISQCNVFNENSELLEKADLVYDTLDGFPV